MSASHEMLMEQIRNLQTQIEATRDTGQPTAELEKQLAELNQKLQSSAHALNESSSLLKG